ncbi:MAG: hypothetical protein HS126_40520 [Anaerolineales bacterium]|nr:hypothetical protein [Anaerolineales bacterium]
MAGRQGQRDQLGKEAAVERENFGAQGDGKTAGVHGAPQLFQQRFEGGRVDLGLGQNLGKAPGRQQADIFGEHGKEAAHQKVGDDFGGITAFQRPGQLGQPGGNLAGDAGAAARRVQAERVEPDLTEDPARVLPLQIGQAQAVGMRVRERDIVAAGKDP